MSPFDTIAKAILSARADAIIATDDQGFICFWNPGAERIFGYTSGEAIGHSLNLIIPERLRQRYWEGFRHTIDSGKSRYGDGDLLSVPAIRKDESQSQSNSQSCCSKVNPDGLQAWPRCCATSARASRKRATSSANWPRQIATPEVEVGQPSQINFDLGSVMRSFDGL